MLRTHSIPLVMAFPLTGRKILAGNNKVSASSDVTIILILIKPRFEQQYKKTLYDGQRND